MKLLDSYFNLQEDIFEYFGYKEDWRVYPIVDSRAVFWHLDEANDTIHFSYDEDNMKKLVANDFDYDRDDINENDYYANDVLPDRFLPKSVYRGDEYTMILVDTNTDGNRFLRVFDNIKEQNNDN